jgi:serine/threonine protein kinase
MVEVNIDHYKLTGIIGRGGMGAIYYGEDVDLKRPVAIKMVRPDLSADPNLVERFYAEAVTTAKLNHPNIATVHDLVRQNNTLLLVMEFIRGWTLSQVLRICDRLPPEQAIVILKAALSAIGHAHEQGVIHRDLKPTNLMLNQNGLIKVMDFGIARLENGPEYTRAGERVGTPQYMPPEQIRGEKPDARTDIYALGIVLYKLLTGRVPFAAENDFQLMKDQVETPPPPPKQFIGALSDQLQAVVLKALSKSVKARYATALDFAEALEKCPENRRGGQRSELAALADYMKSKHPLTIKPLNQSAAEDLRSFIPRQFPLPPDQDKGRSNLSPGTPAGLNGRRRPTLMAVFLFLVIAISGLTALFLIKESSKTGAAPQEAQYGFGEPATDAADPLKNPRQGDEPTSLPDQQKESEWIITRQKQ